MQRRHAIIAAVALAALVLIPAAVLASGPGGGFGHRSPLEGKGFARGPADWAGNATAPNWTGGDCTGAGDCARNATHPDWTRSDGPGNRTPHGNATCAANLSCGRDGGVPGDPGTVTGPACDQDRPRFGNRTAANKVATQEGGRTPGPQGRGGRCPSQ